MIHDTKTLGYTPPESIDQLRREAEVLFRLALSRERELYECLQRIEHLEKSLKDRGH